LQAAALVVDILAQVAVLVDFVLQLLQLAVVEV
jgi:hypothetical protein